MIGFCKDCRSWKPKLPGDQGASIGVGQCTVVLNYFDVVDQDESKFDDEYPYSDDVLRPQFKDIKAVGLDGSGYRAELLTMPDFGCTNFAPKE